MFRKKVPPFVRKHMSHFVIICLLFSQEVNYSSFVECLKTLLSNGMMSYSTLRFHSYTRINTKNILKHMCAGCCVEQKTWKRKWKKQRLSRALTYVANCLKFQHGKYMPIYTQIHFTRYKHSNSRHFLSFF